MSTTLLILLVGLFVCHYLADFTHLSMNFMLEAKRTGKPLLPIFIHALVHADLMFFFLLFMTPNTKIVTTLFLIELFSHFAIDTRKGRMNVWFKKVASPSNKIHWVVFGADQLLHSLIIVLMVYLFFVMQ